MREAGCTTVSFGFESANAQILKTVKKGLTQEKMIAAVKMCNEAGVLAHASFIMGLPGETPETMEETIRFTEYLKDQGALSGFHLLAPFPGTLVREHAEQYGIDILTDDWSQYHANRAVVRTSTVTPDMLNDIVISLEEKTVLHVKQMEERVKAQQADEQETHALRRLERMGIFYDMMMKGVLESNGKQPASAVSRSNGLNQVADQFRAVQSHYSQQCVSDALKYAAQNGFLVKPQGEEHWQWVEFLS